MKLPFWRSFKAYFCVYGLVAYKLIFGYATGVAKQWRYYLSIMMAIILLVTSPSPAAAGFCERALDALQVLVKSEGVQKRLKFYNPLNQSGHKINAIKLLGQKFYLPSEKGAVVGISGYAGLRANINRPAGDFLTGKPFADDKNVFSFDVESPEQFIAKLEYVYKKSGPIYRLAMLGHGMPGQIELGGRKLTKFWAWKNSKLFSSLPHDLFAKDAQIVILACNCAQGNVLFPETGVNKIKSIFSKFVKQGAQIVASRHIVQASLEGFDESEVIQQTRAQEDESYSRPWVYAVLIPLGLFIISLEAVLNIWNIFWLDSASKYEPIAVIDLPPVEQENTNQ